MIGGAAAYAEAIGDRCQAAARADYQWIVAGHWRGAARADRGCITAPSPAQAGPRT